jgi:hypothetical protein
MPYPFCNRQKIRGWPEYLRKLDRLEKNFLPLNQADLAASGWTAYQLWIAPFSNLVKRNPPGWYFRRYVESMFRVMQQWEQELIAQGDDYYLALWLFEPAHAISQVVAATGNRIDFYRQRFRPKAAPARFPQCVAPLQLQHPWTAHWHLNEYWIDEDDSPAEIAHLRHLAIDEKTVDTQTVLFIPDGDLWIHDRSRLRTD